MLTAHAQHPTGSLQEIEMISSPLESSGSGSSRSSRDSPIDAMQSVLEREIISLSPKSSGLSRSFF